jgi:hypothetical protein
MVPRDTEEKAGLMPHYKCVACKARLYSAGRPADPVGDLCPGCGSLLEPVGELAEVVGFRSIKSRDGGADGPAPGRHQRIAGRVGDLMARREAILAEARLDAEGWLDDGGRFSPEAVAEAMALATPRESP